MKNQNSSGDPLLIRAHRAARLLFAFFLSLSVFPGLLAGTVTADSGISRTLSGIAASERSLDHTFNILILGSDQQAPGKAWRTDTIMVAAVDWEKERVGLLSIPRDLYVELPDGRQGRINELDYIGESEDHSGGGPALASQVISNTLGVRTTKYVQLEMSALAQMIDALGGITITVQTRLIELAPDPNSPTNYSVLDLAPGQHHMDGQSALRYIRSRLITGQFESQRRQQQVAWAMRQRFMELGWLPRLSDLWASFNHLVETDLSLLDMVRLAWIGARINSSQFHGLTLDEELLTKSTAPDGDSMLLITDRQKVDLAIDRIFSSPPLNAPEKPMPVNPTNREN